MNDKEERSFWAKVHALCQEDLLYSSRIHSLKSFSTPQSPVYIKREDESSFGISGYKKRKFASLLPYLKHHQFEEVWLVGGAHSNHIVAAAQLLKEQGIPFRLALKKPSTSSARGNLFLLALLTSPEDILWIESTDWDQVEKIVKEQIEGKNGLCIPEGGCMPEVIPGLCTLWEDIFNRQSSAPLPFTHIVMDAGTGMSAAVMQVLLGLFDAPIHLHIVLMAGSEAAYINRYEQVLSWFTQLFSPIVPSPVKAHLHQPSTARSFGSVNAAVKEMCHYMAREEGVLCDPIYSAKLFLQARQLLQTGQIEGTTLLIHSGGGTGLMGFAENWNLSFT